MIQGKTLAHPRRSAALHWRYQIVVLVAVHDLGSELVLEADVRPPQPAAQPVLTAEQHREQEERGSRRDCVAEDFRDLALDLELVVELEHREVVEARVRGADSIELLVGDRSDSRLGEERYELRVGGAARDLNESGVEAIDRRLVGGLHREAVVQREQHVGLRTQYFHVLCAELVRDTHVQHVQKRKQRSYENR